MPLRTVGFFLTLLCLAGPVHATAPVEERLDKLEQQLVEIRLIRENLAEQTAAVSRLETEVAGLKGLVEELKHKLEQADRSEELAKRIARLEAQLASAPPSAPAEGQTATSSKMAKPPTEDEAFQQAKELFKKGQMEQARQALEKFIVQFPASNMVPAAKFWIGETYYYQKRFEEAILEYQKVIQDHPKAEKVPSALLKQAFTFAELGDTTSARLILQRLIEEYPETQQATIAKKKLAVLKK